MKNKDLEVLWVEIDWGKLKPLIEDVGGVFKRFKQDLVNFFEGQDSGGLVSS